VVGGLLMIVTFFLDSSRTTKIEAAIDGYTAFFMRERLCFLLYMY
jgi:hypothetical protein